MPSTTTPPPSTEPPPPAIPSPAALRQLRTVLAQLYPDQRSATRVADDAGLRTVAIDWGGSALDNWHALLQAAQNQNRLDALLDVVREEYSANPALAAAIRGLQP